VVATKSGAVVFERYYDRYTELEKAEIREAFQQATDHINLAHDNHEFVGSFRCVGWLWRRWRWRCRWPWPVCGLSCMQEQQQQQQQQQQQRRGRGSTARPVAAAPSPPLFLRLPQCRGAPFVLVPTTDLVFYALGCGEYDEMARECCGLVGVALGVWQWQAAEEEEPLQQAV